MPCHAIVAAEEIVPATAVVSAKVLVAVILAVIISITQSFSRGDALPVLAAEGILHAAAVGLADIPQISRRYPTAGLFLSIANFRPTHTCARLAPELIVALACSRSSFFSKTD